MDGGKAKLKDKSRRSSVPAHQSTGRLLSGSRIVSIAPKSLATTLACELTAAAAPH